MVFAEIDKTNQAKQEIRNRVKGQNE